MAVDRAQSCPCSGAGGGTKVFSLFEVPAYTSPDMLAPAIDEVLAQWPWNSLELGAGTAPTIAPRLTVLVDTAAGGDLKVYFGGTDGNVDGILAASFAVPASAFVARTFLGPAVATPAAGATLVKLVGADAAAIMTVRGARLVLAP